MCAFMPKYQKLPFLADDISGSRALALFVVEDSASMMVAEDLKATKRHALLKVHELETQITNFAR